MKNENICKFSPARSSDLICLHFIKEANLSQAGNMRARHHALHLVAEGEGELHLGNASYALSRGSLFFVADGAEFSIRGEGLVYYYISFFGRRAQELMARFGVLSGSGVFGGYEGLIPFWEDCQREAMEGNIDILCESVLLYSLAKLRPAKSERAGAVSQIVAAVQERFSESTLSLPVIAKQIGYDPKYLSSLFKRKKGVSFTQYLREVRLRHAVFLMEQGVDSIKNIALLSGFGDPLYFSKIFAAAMGESPKAYIARLESKTE